MSRIAYIALGSNMGERARTLLEAVKRLDEVPSVRICRISRMTESDPIGPAGQGKYINAAVEVETELTPRRLLAALQNVEKVLGRRRETERRWGPRTCDLDILLIGQVIMETDELTIPHPRMHERTFVLGPLAEIAPDAVHPVLEKTVRQLLSELERT